MKSVASVPPSTATAFTPGTPIDEVCAARNAARTRVEEALKRIRVLAGAVSTPPAPNVWSEEPSHG